jgi:hypothetical protein
MDVVILAHQRRKPGKDPPDRTQKISQYYTCQIKPLIACTN